MNPPTAGARFGKAPQQRIGAGVEEQRADVHALALQVLDQRHQLRQRDGIAHVHGHRHAVGESVMLQSDELAQHLRWQVVDTEEACVFQRVQRHRLARAGNAGDQHHLAPVVRRAGGRTIVGNARHRAPFGPLFGVH
jgi:hypothetical protein